MDRQQMRLLRGLGVDFSLKSRLSNATKIPGEFGSYLKDKASGMKHGAIGMKQSLIDEGYWKSGAIGAGLGTAITYAILCLKNGKSYEEYKDACELSGETPISKAKYIALPTKKDVKSLLKGAGIGAGIGITSDALTRDREEAEEYYFSKGYNFDSYGLQLGAGLIGSAALGGALANAIKRKYDYEAYRIACERKGEKPIPRLKYQALSSENLKAAAFGGATMAPIALALQTNETPVILAGLGLSAIGLVLFKKAMRAQMKYSVYKAICEAKGEKPLSKNIYEDALRVGFIEKSL